MDKFIWSDHTSRIAAIRMMPVAAMAALLFDDFHHIRYGVGEANVVVWVQMVASSWTWCSYQWRTRPSVNDKPNKWCWVFGGRKNINSRMGQTSNLVSVYFGIGDQDGDANRHSHQWVIQSMRDVIQCLAIPASKRVGWYKFEMLVPENG